MTEIGEQMAWFRRQSGMSVNELANKSGVNRQTIWNLESGNCRTRYETIKLLLAAMGYDLVAVKFREGEQK